MNVFFNARLGADAELKESQKGQQFIAMRAVYNEYNKAKGENEAIWVNIVADASEYNKKMLQYWTKGKLLSFSGKERVSLFTSKDGNVGIDRTVRANSIDFVSGGSSGDTNANQSTTTQTSTPQVDCGTLRQPTMSTSVASTLEDDLPF